MSKKLKKKIIYFIISLIIAGISSAVIGTNNPDAVKDVFTTKTQAKAVKGISSTTATVVEVIDGDTFKLDSGEKVRMIGIDTPELHHPKKAVQCYGEQAMQQTKQMIENRMVRLEKDVSETDRYGRLLRYVYLINLSPTPLAKDQASEVFVNEYLVQQGFARAATFPPDVKNSDYFSLLQKQAENNNLGLWKDCN